jgi:type I restriction enzyme S subunit
MKSTILNIDKSNWKLVKFGDVVAEPKETCKDIIAEGIEHVVGLEHIDSGDLHLRKSASIEESTTFTKKFKKGDVLFGRRRAYLKKAAKAEFDGICSGDITVFRAKKELLPSLLPFIVNNDKFFDYAVKHSAGGLSPRVKFKDLANYEFLLPPKEEQAKLAELLWAMDEVVEKEKAVFKNLDSLFKAKIKYISNDKQHISESKKIKDVCIIKDNLRKPLNSSERDTIKGEIPYYGANGLVDRINDYIFNEDLVLVAEDGGNFNEFFNKEIAYTIKGKSWVNNHAHVLTVKNNLIPIDWLYFSLVHKNLLKYIIGTTRLKLNKSELENVKIWVPSKEKINNLVFELKKIYEIRKDCFSNIYSTLSLQKSLINQIF